MRKRHQIYINREDHRDNGEELDGVRCGQHAPGSCARWWSCRRGLHRTLRRPPPGRQERVPRSSTLLAHTPSLPLFRPGSVR